MSLTKLFGYVRPFGIGLCGVCGWQVTSCSDILNIVVVFGVFFYLGYWGLMEREVGEGS